MFSSTLSWGEGGGELVIFPCFLLVFGVVVVVVRSCLFVPCMCLFLLLDYRVSGLVQNLLELLVSSLELVLVLLTSLELPRDVVGGR